MSIKLSVGLSRKVGEANYGSRGASANIEVEVDAALAGDPEKLPERIRQLYATVRSSLDEELRSHRNSQPAPAPEPAPVPAAEPPPYRNGTARNGDGRPATRAQVKAIFAITKQQKIDLHALLRTRFNAYRADDLSLAEASRLIDDLKSNPGAR